MTDVRVECPKCGQKAWARGSQTITHAACPKKGHGPSPVYVPVDK